VRHLQHKFQAETVPHKANIYRTANKLRQSGALLDKKTETKCLHINTQTKEIKDNKQREVSHISQKELCVNVKVLEASEMHLEQ
jgi:hypothetical protein